MRGWIRGGAVVVVAATIAGGASRLSTAAGEAPGDEARGDRDAAVPAAKAAGRLRLPDGFKATLFAAEPDVVQPIGFDIDPRGRLWVAECYSYPSWRGGPKGKDRILIFEDVDGDGRFDSRKVFWEGGTDVTSVTVGFGGAWVCSPPNLLFIPDHDGDDRPDGPPVVKLTGWSTQAQHNFVNGLSWGPDGWLWGMNGILSESKVGAPGTPEDRRVPMNCGVWRYHPTRETFEVVAHGTTNPWGLDFDEVGEAFITNCVIPHLYRVVPGAHYQRMFGSDLNPNAYGLMPTCADHIHWAGGSWTDSRGGLGKHGEAGGGHAHVGAMVYLGDNWPERYRGGVFTCNLHGRRVNHDTLERRGAGYVARHAKDFLNVDDEWFRGIELQYGPDGGVYLTDWSDIGECHETDDDGSHRENGRIFKITYGDVRPVRVDLDGRTDEELVGFLSHKNEWYSRTARRILQERAAAGRPMAQVREALRRKLNTGAPAPERLRALWALHATGGADEALLTGLLGDASEYVRSWAVRLLGDGGLAPASALGRFEAMAREERSPWVRLSLASALQRIPVSGRWGIAEALVSHREDASDAESPLMLWYGIEPLVPSDRGRAISLLKGCEIPLLRQYLARRLLSEDVVVGLEGLLPLLKTGGPAEVGPLLEGISEALLTRKTAPLPAGWPDVAATLARSADPSVRLSALRLSLKFEAPGAAEALRVVMNRGAAEASEREGALSALVAARVPGTAVDLRKLLDDHALRGAAIRALATFDDPETPGAILRRYADLTGADKADALVTLATRSESALALLDAVGRGTVPRGDITATTARQVLNLRDARIARKLEEVWGTLRPTSKAKSELMGKYRRLLAPDRLETASARRGRSVFEKTCSQCHRLFDAGGDVGPDLTGSDRAKAEYILENVLDPSAAVAHDYKLTTVATTDGRLLSGIVKERTPTGLVLRTANERLAVPKEEVEQERPTQESMMPEGLLEGLSDRDVLDLFAYLAAGQQVPAEAARPKP